MNLEVGILAVAAFTMVALPVSLAVRGTLPWLERQAAQLAPQEAVLVWLAASALPTFLGGLAVLASLLPAFGFGPDHCLTHGDHHPHLCPRHATFPGAALVVVALAYLARLGHGLGRLTWSLHTQWRVSTALDEAAEAAHGTSVFPSPTPGAFVLGLIRPRIYVSSGLAELGPELRKLVVAHERAHAVRRDPLWRALGSLLSINHPPSIGSTLEARLVLAQERAADEAAAAAFPDGRLKMAAALVSLARRASPAHPLAVAFGHAHIKLRVRALLGAPPPPCSRPARSLTCGALLVTLLALMSHASIHDALETLLGALS